MPKFQYTARTRDGKLETDVLETSSLESAVSILQNQQLVVIKIEPLGKTGGFDLGGVSQFIEPLLNRVKSQEIVLFTKQLATLIQAKVPLVQSLRVMVKQINNPVFSKIIADIADEVDAGSVFSRALAKYPRIFSNFYVQMVRSGEISGRLEETLLYLAEYINRQFMLNSKAKGAMIYPAFIVAAFVIIGGLLLVFVIPNITSILIESGQELPLVTKLLIWLTDFVKNWGIVVVIVIAAASYFVSNAIKKSAEWRYGFDKLKIKIPIFGELLRKIYLARFSETLSTLSTAGIAISQSLELTADVVGNSVYKRIILEANEAVRRGGTISSVFVNYGEIIPMVTQMISIGEQTGKLDSILKQVTNFFTDEVNRAFDNIVNSIEPLLIMFLGAGVGILVAAVLIPIYNLTNAF